MFENWSSSQPVLETLCISSVCDPLRYTVEMLNCKKNYCEQIINKLNNKCQGKE